MSFIEYHGDQDELPQNEPLQKFEPNYQGSPECSSPPSRAVSPQNGQRDPGLPVLFPQICLCLSSYQSREDSSMSGASNMADILDEPPPVAGTSAAHDMLQNTTESEDHGHKSSVDSAVDLSDHTAKSGEDCPGSESAIRELATRPRADSTQVDALTASKVSQSTHAALRSPLKIQTTGPDSEAPHRHQERDSISASPTLSKHVIPSAEVHGQSLAPFEPPSPSASSPKAERLPSIHQITSSLTELAEAATQEIPRQQQGFSHHHSQSFGSAMSQSPILSNHAYPPSLQTSPQAYYQPTMVTRSPTSTIGESHYASPPAYPHYGAYSHRRASMVDGAAPIMPRLPTASSSGDSYCGYPSSGTEGYSTNHTTPIDISHTAEHTPRPMLPPPPGMHAVPLPPPPIMIPGPYKCDVPDCTAGTFQTQYLLKYARRIVCSSWYYLLTCDRQLA
jgi:hypothetical protein